MTTLFLALLFACAFADIQHFEACEKDRDTFCAGTSHHELHRCMHDHWAQLSQDCQAAITQFVQEHQAKVQAACGSDMDTFCADVKEDFEQLKQCMSSNWESITQECRDVLSHHRHQQEEPREEEPHPACPLAKCHDDVHTLCPEATTKEARHDCLKNNFAALSEECRAAIEEMIRHNNAQQAETQVETQEGSATSSDDNMEGMAYREIETSEGGDVVVQEEPSLGGTMQPTPWYYWFTRLWWTYPVGLVGIIQLLACIRVRQIRQQEAELL